MHSFTPSRLQEGGGRNTTNMRFLIPCPYKSCCSVIHFQRLPSFFNHSESILEVLVPILEGSSLCINRTLSLIYSSEPFRLLRFWICSWKPWKYLKLNLYETNLFPFHLSFLTFKKKEKQSKIKQNPKSKNLLFFLTFLFYFMEPLTPSHQSWKQETHSLFLTAPVPNLSPRFHLSCACHLCFLKPTQNITAQLN